MKLQYPLVKKDGASYSADELLKILAKEPSGHYLLGSHGFWHGGVHFTDKITPDFKNASVKAVAEGKIVAYRIAQEYEPFVYENDTKKICEIHHYATSFCLIRHEYESPVPAQKMQNAQAAPSDKKGWEGRIVELKEGRNVRNPHATSDSDKTCTFRVNLPKGTRLKIITNDATNDNFYTAKIASFTSKKTSETFTNAKGGNHTLNIGDEVFFHGFDTKTGNPVFKDASNSMQDWSETQSLAVKSSHRGYAFLLPQLPEEYIHIPAGTQLTPTQTVTASTRHGKVFMQVTANIPLDIYTEHLCTTKQHPAGTLFYIAVTDEFGNMETAQTTDSAGKTQQTPVVENNTRNKLTFYSLYMHLLPYDAYDKDPNEGKNFVRSDIADLDERSSANDWNDKNGNYNVTATVAKGTIYELVSTTPTTADGFKFYQGYQADVTGNRLSQNAVWFKKEDKAGNRQYVVPHTMPSTAKEYPLHWKIDNTIECKALGDIQACIVQQHNGKLTLAALDTLQKDDTFTYHYPNDLITFKKLVVGSEEKDTELIKITLTKGQGKNNQLANTNKQLYLQKGEATPQTIKETFTPKKMDEVVSCDIPVKAGEHLGYPGLYETPSDGADGTKVNKDGNKNSKHQLHFEIFTNDKDRIDSFLDNKAKVTTGRKYLKVNKRTYVMFGTNPDTLANTAPTTGLPLPYFNATAYLITDWVLPLNETPISKDKQGVEWYRLPVGKLAGAALTKDHYGWVRKGQATEELNQYDLRKLGFTIIEEEDETSNGDMFVDAGKIKGEEVKEFFQAILNKIDELGNNNGKVTPDEIQAAYKREDLSDTLQKIIGYHPTEWRQDNKIIPIEIVANRIRGDIENGKDEGEKNRLAPIQNDHEAIVKEFAGEDALKFLKREQERINKLVFWDKVEELKSTPKVWHFHPVAFIEHIKSGVTLQPVMPKKPENIRKIVLHCTASKEGANQTVEDVRRYHTTPTPNGRGWAHIGYHYVIHLDGSIHFGCHENVKGIHVSGYNSDSIGVVYVGGVDVNGKAKDTRTPEQKVSLVNLVETLLERYPNATIHGHNEFAAKACPSFDVQKKENFGRYNEGKTPDLRSYNASKIDAF